MVTEEEQKKIRRKLNKLYTEYGDKEFWPNVIGMPLATTGLVGSSLFKSQLSGFSKLSPRTIIRQGVGKGVIDKFNKLLFQKRLSNAAAMIGIPLLAYGFLQRKRAEDIGDFLEDKKRFQSALEKQSSLPIIHKAPEFINAAFKKLKSTINKPSKIKELLLRMFDTITKPVDYLGEKILSSISHKTQALNIESHISRLKKILSPIKDPIRREQILRSLKGLKNALSEEKLRGLKDMAIYGAGVSVIPALGTCAYHEAYDPTPEEMVQSMIDKKAGLYGVNPQKAGKVLHGAMHMKLKDIIRLYVKHRRG